jgi:glycosyltransferase involved in cell wall biosynthesis
MVTSGDRGAVRRTTIPSTRRRVSIRRASPDQPAIAALVVVVPARNEAATITACLRSIDRAAEVADVRTSVVVAADCCRDATAARARAAAASAKDIDITVLEGSWRGPSAARAVGVRHALARSEPAATWLAHTDADCVVGPRWLAGHLGHARAGWDAIAGTVVLDASAPIELRERFAAAYTLGVDAHRHVHAANFGVRADAYLAAGGWLARTVVGEEHDLWRRLARRGFRGSQPLDVAVTTSARRRGRVVGGFASWLARLEGADVADC